MVSDRQTYVLVVEQTRLVGIFTEGNGDERIAGPSGRSPTRFGATHGEATGELRCDHGSLDPSPPWHHHGTGHQSAPYQNGGFDLSHGE